MTKLDRIREDPNWEHGSWFHWNPDSLNPSPGAGSFASRVYGTGRQALSTLLNYGVVEREWRRLWIPAYYCPETIHAISSLVDSDVKLAFFDDGPLDSVCAPPLGDLTAGDVVLVVNYFGLSSAARHPASLPAGVDTIEDHTHDPWSEWVSQSTASYGFASLRKTLPIPDGGALWSPRGEGLPLPAGRSELHDSAAAMRLESMVLKAAYLSGRPIDKRAYLEMSRRSERLMGAAPVSAVSKTTEEAWPLMPALAWRGERLRNFRRARDGFAGVPGVSVVHPETENETPFSIVLRLAGRVVRDRLRSHLIRNSVYPSVLWHLDPEVAERFRKQGDVSDVLLCIHCDFRYTPNEIDRVVDLVVGGLKA